MRFFLERSKRVLKRNLEWKKRIQIILVRFGKENENFNFIKVIKKNYEIKSVEKNCNE